MQIFNDTRLIQLFIAIFVCCHDCKIIVTHMKLHFSVVFILIHTELFVFGENMKQFPFSLIHEHILVVFYFLGRPY